MKNRLALALAFVSCFALALAGCGGNSKPAEKAPAGGIKAAAQKAAGDKNTIILAHFGAPNEPVTLAAETFKKEVEARSKGALKVEIHGNSELGNAKEMVEQTAMGAIQACLVSQGSLDKYDIRYALVTAPYVYSGYKQAYAVMDGPFAKWVSDGTLEKKGLHNVGAWDYGFRCLTNSKRAVKSPADVKGLKIRTPSEVQKVACFEALGADVQQIAFSELITALKQGTVDGQENPLSTIYNNSMWEAEQKFLSLTRHTYEAVNLTFSNDYWKGLSADQQKIITEASAVARDQMRKAVQDGEADYINKLKAKGVTVTEVDLAEFKKAMQPAWDKVAEYEGSKEDMNKFLKMVEETK
jgi:tripartite ATP-independent transporter DctP family solute receptor